MVVHELLLNGVAEGLPRFELLTVQGGFLRDRKPQGNLAPRFEALRQRSTIGVASIGRRDGPAGTL